MVVGYGTHISNEAATLGWIIGPKFAIDPDEKNVFFRHAPIQNSLAAIISVPAWWRKAKVEVSTKWLREDGSIVFDQKSVGYEIKLPARVSDITAALRTGAVKEPRLGRGIPRVSLALGQPASLLIPGENLWRSTVVTIGAQRSRQITVLPNMEGIIAHFDRIEAPADWIDRSKPYDQAQITIWTSAGMVTLEKTALIYDPVKFDPLGALQITALANRFVSGQALTLKIASATLPSSYAQLRLGIRPHILGREIKWTESERAPNADPEGNILSEVITVSQSSPGKTYFRNGAEIEAALLVWAHPDALQKAAISTKRLIFYEDDASAKVKLETAEITKLTERVRFSFPISGEKAYPGFAAELASFNATIPDHPKIKLIVEGEKWPTSATEKYLLKLGLDTSAPGSEEEYEKQHAAGDLTVEFKIIGKTGAEVPLVDKRLIVKKKQ